MRINAEIVSFAYESQHRAILTKGVVNPTDETGKIGVRKHNRLSRWFHDTVHIMAKEKDKESPTVNYLNRKSMIRWINAQAEDKLLPSTASDWEIDLELRKICGRDENLPNPVQERLHIGKPSTHSLFYPIDKAKGMFWDLFWNVTTVSFHLFLARFSVLSTEKSIENASIERATAIFWSSLDSVPAYKDHIANSKAFPQIFAEIPLTDKESYIKLAANKNLISDLMVGGRLPFNGQCDTSTGTTGKPSMWIRGPKERETIKSLLHYAIRVVMPKEQPIFFINAFALGPWATGMTLSTALSKRAIAFSAGSDLEKILGFLAQFPPENCKERKYVIAGYPPLMKDLVEKARTDKFDLNKYQLHAVVGGEPMADGIRDYLLGVNQNGEKESQLQAFHLVLSTYGASDLDINIGYESAFEQELRRACKSHPKFAEELYGRNEPVPSIFHYDPLNYYIEASECQELIFTCGRNDRVSPRVRYNLHDRGKRMRVQDVMAIAKKHGVEIPKPRTNLPLIFVWGRENTINFRGAKVPIEHLQEAIARNERLAKIVKNQAFKEIETIHGYKVTIMLELEENEKLDLGEEESCRMQLIDQLQDLNPDFRFQVEAIQNLDDLPALKVYSSGTGPLSKQDPHRKKQYIFREKLNEGEPTLENEERACV